jgi:hypothetical protein
MTRTEEAALQELERTPEQIAAKTAEMDALAAQPAPAANGRKERADKGQPRLYVEITGVRFDLSEPAGRAMLGRIVQAGEPTDAVIGQLLDIIERLRK